MDRNRENTNEEQLKEFVPTIMKTQKTRNVASAITAHKITIHSIYFRNNIKCGDCNNPSKSHILSSQDPRIDIPNNVWDSFTTRTVMSIDEN